MEFLSECEAGWEKFEFSCYKFITDSQLSWVQANVSFAFTLGQRKGWKCVIRSIDMFYGDFIHSFIR